MNAKKKKSQWGEGEENKNGTLENQRKERLRREGKEDGGELKICVR